MSCRCGTWWDEPSEHGNLKTVSSEMVMQSQFHADGFIDEFSCGVCGRRWRVAYCHDGGVRNADPIKVWEIVEGEPVRFFPNVDEVLLEIKEALRLGRGYFAQDAQRTCVRQGYLNLQRSYLREWFPDGGLISEKEPLPDFESALECLQALVEAQEGENPQSYWHRVWQAMRFVNASDRWPGCEVQLDGGASADRKTRLFSAKTHELAHQIGAALRERFAQHSMTVDTEDFFVAVTTDNLDLMRQVGKFMQTYKGKLE